jgi:hypothetical protein
MKALLAILAATALWPSPPAWAGHGHDGGPWLGLWLGVPPPIVQPGYLHGYPAYPRSYPGHHHRYRHDHHGDSDSDSDSGHRHHRGCH